MSSVYHFLRCECGGRLLQRHVSKLSKNQFIKRTRKCESCGKLVHTIELPIETYNKSVKLLNSIIKEIKSSQTE